MNNTCRFCGKDIEIPFGIFFCSKKCYANNWYKEHKKSKEPKVCKICGESFHPKHSNSEYCSVGCYKIHSKIFSVLSCPQCNKKFQQTHANQKFCNGICSSIFRGIHRKRTEKIAICPACGKTYKTSRSNRLYCSQECRLNRIRSPKDPQRYVKTCPACNKEFISEIQSKKYCSLRCCRRARDLRRTERDKSDIEKSSCAVCGFGNLKAIHRHHINPDLGNSGGLISLCANCHYIFHGSIGWNGNSEKMTPEDVKSVIIKNS